MSPANFLKLGIVVLLEHNAHVLITRRCSHLRAFPSAWYAVFGILYRYQCHDRVFPGGQLDPGETPAEAGARELLEETGSLPPSSLCI